MGKNWLAWVLLALIAAAFVAYYAIRVEPYDLQLKEVRFPLFNQTVRTAPKIVFVSDIHYATYEKEYWEKAQSLINAQKPDLILIGGDIVNSGTGQDIAQLDRLRDLHAKNGIYAVLGNHDYDQWGWQPGSLDYASRVGEKLESMGIRVLRNEHVVIDEGKNEFALAGLDDGNVHRQDYAKATDGLDASIPRLVMMHEPAAIQTQHMVGKNVVLSGHTHCGLVYVPYLTNAILWAIGFGWDAGGKVELGDGNEQYIGCGLTPGGIRLFTNPQITVIRLS